VEKIILSNISKNNSMGEKRSMDDSLDLDGPVKSEHTPLCFGDGYIRPIVETRRFGFLSALDTCEDFLVHAGVVCMHSGACNRMHKRIAVVPPPYLGHADVLCMISILCRRPEQPHLFGSQPVQYTMIVDRLNYLSCDDELLDVLFEHAREQAAITQSVVVAYEMSRMFRRSLRKDVLRTVDFTSLKLKLNDTSRTMESCWDLLADKTWQDVLGLVTQLQPLEIVVPRDPTMYVMPFPAAATLLNVPADILGFVAMHTKQMTIAGGAALALRYLQTSSSLLLPSSDVDVFLFRSTDQDPAALKQLVQLLRSNDYIVCRSRACVLTAVHATFRTVQLIGSSASDGPELLRGFDLCNVQLYYDGTQCYETVQSAHANTAMELAISANIELRTVSTQRLYKMVRKGFSCEDVDIRRYLDATVRPTIQATHDYQEILEGRHSYLEPLQASDVLLPLTMVPEYQRKQAGQWFDDKTQTSLDRLLSYVTRCNEQGQSHKSRIHKLTGLEIDLGCGTMPMFATVPDGDLANTEYDVSTEHTAHDTIVSKIKKFVLGDVSNYRRLCVVRSAMGALASGGRRTRQGFGNQYLDIGIRMTKNTVFYLDGKYIESSIQIATLLLSRECVFHVFSDCAYVPEFRAECCTLQFILTKVFITRPVTDHLT
jgi:hypothetical protein